MPVPTYDQFIEPILRFLAKNPDGVPAPVAHDDAASKLNLSEEDRSVLLPSGVQRMYKNRAGWAHDRLKRAGLSSSPKHGFWKLTPAGVDFARENPAPLSEAVVQRLAVDFLGVTLKPIAAVTTPSAIPLSGPKADVVNSVASPDDQLEQALAELKQAAIAEVQERLAHVSSSFFELIVLEVLHRMGYGATRDDVTQVGGPGDAGIDGVISLDRLGLEKVYVQAKRWQDVISRPQLQAFYGALAGQKAKKGVFITTSAYTSQARDFAKSVDGMVLIDGERLASLMIEYEVGITSRKVRVPKIDSDYFDEDAT
ncbi:MAG: restriction endonuclease [Rhizobacter sp.]